ncbi:carboxypeptidase-like regulatory domain-containing protein [Fuchsiella alkaliacetigena]|uniref:carboxypeptidase-like regulatory domain-containing protein n=1 Tax=Fuchsiella alkaliacetigena TaxID=957042 RepID=UPI00200A4E02|nr:carboxypeptidase-like regulatory domain-containing protein [Fuchsiella alkaliacetigena]MCK8823576.1 carboxypeptidase-like regulatory domain-containing protein [Fuchsiella alkaliacetigena]
MNKLSKFLPSLIIIVICLLIVSGSKVKAASVLDLMIMMDDPELEDILLGELELREELRIIEADEIDDILADEDLEDIDQVQEAEAQEADFVITGILINLGGSFFRLNFEMVDINEGITIYSSNVTGEREEILEEMIEDILPEVKDSLLLHNLKGQVVDGEGRPISEAEIRFTGDYDSVVTDEEGYWEKKDLLGTVELEIEKEGWEFNPTQKEASVRTGEVEFKGKELPYLEEIEVEFETDEFYQGQRYIIKAEGYDQYGEEYEIEPEWQVWGDVGEIVSTSYDQGRISLATTAPGSGTLELMAEEQIKEVDFEVLATGEEAESVTPVLQPWSLELGISYNFYDLEKFNEQMEEQGGSENSSGLGFYLRAKRGLEQINFAREHLPSEVVQDISYGLELERLGVGYDDLDEGAERKLSTTGVLGTAAYQLFEERLELNLAVGQYLVTKTDGSGGTEDRHFGFGFKPGASFELGVVSDKFREEISNRVGIKGRVSYRFAEVGDYDFSGFEFGLLGGFAF